MLNVQPDCLVRIMTSFVFCVDLDSGQNFKIHYFYMLSSINDKLPEFLAPCGLFKEWVSFFSVHEKWIAVRNKQIEWIAKRFSCDLFVPHCYSFPMNREKKTLIPYIYNAYNKRPLLKFSEQSKKFKFPAEIGHLTLFPDKTILVYSFCQNSALINGEKVICCVCVLFIF